MRIKTLTIHNFRGIKKLEDLELGDLNTFVGKNDSGKSIILRALDCFFNSSFTEKDFFKGKESEEYTVIQVSFLPEISLDDLILDSNKLFTIKKEFYLDNKNGKIKTREYYLADDFVEERYQDLWNKKEQELIKIQDELKIQTVRSGRGNTNLERRGLIKETLKNIKRKNKFNVLGELLSRIKEDNNVFLPEYYLFDADKNLDIESTDFQSKFKPVISSCLENHKETTKKIEEEIKKELHKEFENIRMLMVKNVSGIKQMNPVLNCDWKKSVGFDINFNFEGEDYLVPISHKGTGFKRLLMVAYFEYLANKKEIKDNIFAIEEPETYLHPSAQNDLLNSIILISKYSQFFITTHSPIFAGASNGNYAVMVKKNSRGISEYSRSDYIIKEIIEELGIKPDYNLLENKKCILFVEGKDDVEFIRIAAKTILNKDLECDGIALMVGGGSSLKNSADLGLLKKLNSNGKYAILKDGDNGDISKQKEKKRIEETCKKEKALFFSLSKRSIENYCPPERIKSCYKEVPNISSIKIEIKEETNVEDYLKSLGLNGFKAGKNVEVFRQMTFDEWKEVDPKEEIKSFLNDLYNLAK